MFQVVGGLRPAAIRVQWMQLLVLSGTHFLVDMFGNTLPSILPVIREEFSLTLAMGTLVIASLGLASNAFQILTGHLRARQTRPFFLYVGMLLAAAVCLMALAPKSALGVVLLLVFGTISGFGIAVAHPEGLRAVHTLRRIPASWSTAIFMTTGFFGSACGAVVAARLVHGYGLKGLYPLMVCPSLGLLAVGLSRVRLAVERNAPAREETAANGSSTLPFREVMLVGLPAALSTTAVQWMTPTYLHELGFALTSGGFAAAMFGWGGAVGPFLWAAIAGRMGDLPACAWSFLLSVVFALSYFVLATHPAAVWLLFGAGFCSMSGYILTVTLARSAGGLCLGHRMSLIVGGTWGIAFVVLLGLMAIADRVGMGLLLKLTPLGYLASALYAFYVLRQYPLLARSHQRASAADLADPEQASA
jgi:MFS transporter, FSR family, fosmidomycin resistance protein